MALRAIPHPALIAGAALLGATALAARAGWRAARIDPLPAPAAGSAPVGNTRIAPRTTGDTAANVLAAVEKDPFHPERRRPTVRFRFPGETSPAAAAPAPSWRAAADPLRLIGTVVRPGGEAFAMCQVGDGAPRIVRLGEEIGGMKLERVEPGRAVFAGAGGKRVEIKAPRAGGT